MAIEMKINSYYDVRDLDRWIDALKSKAGSDTTDLEPDAYLARLDR
jgi:hypothetical protein